MSFIGLSSASSKKPYHSPIDKQQSVISLRGVEKSFGRLTVLRGVDLDVYKGENVVVLGRFGSGKSVLIRIIAGLLQPRLP